MTVSKYTYFTMSTGPWPMNLAYGKPNAGNERLTRWDAAYRASLPVYVRSRWFQRASPPASVVENMHISYLAERRQRAKHVLLLLAANAVRQLHSDAADRRNHRQHTLIFSSCGRQQRLRRLLSHRVGKDALRSASNETLTSS